MVSRLNKLKFSNFSGERQRQYRRDMATAFRVLRAQRDNKAVRAPESVSRAMIFPLEGDFSELEFSDFASDYNATDGVGVGSLFHYWATVLSSGFSLHDNAAQAVAAELAESYAAATAAMQEAMVRGVGRRFWTSRPRCSRGG